VKVPVGILISGRGTNMAALITAAKEGRLSADVRVVVSNRADAPGLERAAALGVPTQVISHRDFPSREAFDSALADCLEAHGVELVALAGFMRVLTPNFLARFPSRIVNIHPSLLPNFPGLNPHRRVLEHGVKVTGCTVHLVVEDPDAGPVLAQEAVEVRPDDTEETLAARVLAVENRLYPEALEAFIRSRFFARGDSRC